MKFAAIFTDKDNARYAHKHLSGKDTLIDLTNVTLCNDTTVTGEVTGITPQDIHYDLKRCGMSTEQYKLYVSSALYGVLDATANPYTICDNSVIAGLLS